MLYKTIHGVTVKADDATPGRFTGYASTWTRTPDSYGDVVKRGAFARTLREWEKKGKPIPVLWGHRMDQPTMFLGTVVEANEDDHGLKVTCDLDLDNPTAAQVHRLIKTRTVAEMSFAFDIIDQATVTEGGQKVRELRDLDLYEVSIVPVGANKDTSIDEVKDGLAHHLTPAQWEALRILADERITHDAEESAPEEGEAEGNAIQGAESEPDEATKARDRAEAVARLNETIDSL